MSEYFSPLCVTAASTITAPSAHDARLLKYEAATVSATVTSQVAQRHGMSVIVSSSIIIMPTITIITQ